MARWSVLPAALSVSKEALSSLSGKVVVVCGSVVVVSGSVVVVSGKVVVVVVLGSVVVVVVSSGGGSTRYTWQPPSKIACPSGDQFSPGYCEVPPEASWYAKGGMMSPQPCLGNTGPVCVP